MPSGYCPLSPILGNVDVTLNGSKNLWRNLPCDRDKGEYGIIARGDASVRTYRGIV
ncbi:hypothetical protein BDZ89DRAFT_1077704 [Hymenopellis radicata]|nr:hypothetical protein BDZ89DRAFT_1077704 [Hymenopellis radicata]